jgi:hypothetical protein
MCFQFVWGQTIKTAWTRRSGLLVKNVLEEIRQEAHRRPQKRAGELGTSYENAGRK